MLSAFLSLHSLSALAAEGQFDYVDYSSWGDLCVKGAIDGEIQQSPINIPSNADLSEKVSLKFVSLPKGNLLLEERLENNHGQLAMHLDTAMNVPLAEIEVKNKIYSLAGIHSHWGASEHFYDNAYATGCFHMVFATVEGDLSVIEVKIDFVSESGEDVIQNFPRCPMVSNDLVDTAYNALGCPAPHTNDHESAENALTNAEDEDILSVFGLSPSSLNGRLTHYTGSLTTPPCSTGVNWFVINEPIKVQDPTGDFIGCRTFRNAYPHQVVDNVCVPGGNFRPRQRVQSSTKFYGVDVSYDYDGRLGLVKGAGGDVTKTTMVPVEDSSRAAFWISTATVAMAVLF